MDTWESFSQQLKSLKRPSSLEKRRRRINPAARAFPMLLRDLHWSQPMSEQSVTIFLMLEEHLSDGILNDPSRTGRT